LKVRDTSESMYNLKKEETENLKSIIKGNYTKELRKKKKFLFNTLSLYKAPKIFSNERLPEVIIFFFKTCNLNNAKNNFLLNRKIQSTLSVKKKNCLISIFLKRQNFFLMQLKVK
jgi:hypothetical protein